MGVHTNFSIWMSYAKSQYTWTILICLGVVTMVTATTSKIEEPASLSFSLKNDENNPSTFDKLCEILKSFNRTTNITNEEEPLEAKIIENLVRLGLNRTIVSEENFQKNITIPTTPITMGQQTDRGMFDNFFLKDPDIKLDIEALVNKYGFHLETHLVSTEDGYITTLHRVMKRNQTNTKGPLLMWHGMYMSSWAFFYISAERALPFLAVNDGWDVWLGNSRGTKYSTLHKFLNPKELPYWKFSTDELGLIDLPANIDYILETTNYKKLTYIGYSLGGSMFFMLMSTRSEYNAKVQKAVIYGPAVFLKNSKSPLALPSVFSDSVILRVGDVMNKGQLFPLREPVGSILKNACRLIYASPLCRSGVFAIGGVNHKNSNHTTVSRFAANPFTPSAIRVFVQSLQFVRTARYQRFDFGAKENLRKYGQRLPPEYRLNQVTVPVYGLCGLADTLTVFDDCSRAFNSLPNLMNRGNLTVQDDNWYHLDFVLGDRAKTLVYDQTFQFINSA